MSPRRLLIIAGLFTFSGLALAACSGSSSPDASDGAGSGPTNEVDYIVRGYSGTAPSGGSSAGGGSATSTSSPSTTQATDSTTSTSTSTSIVPSASPSPSPVPSVSYSYNVQDDQYTENSAKVNWQSECGESDCQFEDVETTQFVDEIPSYITVKAPDEDQCLSVFNGFSGSQFQTLKADGSEPIPVPNAPDKENPQQLTIIPWKSKSTDSCDISKDFDSYDMKVALAVFVSATYWPSPPGGATVCKISKDDAEAINKMYWAEDGSDSWKSKDGSCVIDKPQRRGEVWTGTLYTMLTSGETGPLYIELAPEATLTAPLNSLVYKTTDEKDPEAKKSECVIDTDRQIIVTGFGRLTGSEVNKKNTDKFSGKSKSARYLVDSGQLVLGSRASSGFAIDISGITAANGAIRNMASVQLNDPGLGFCTKTGERSAEGSGGGPVKVIDLKRPGVWYGESDALEVSAKSEVYYSYFQSADDTIKISAPSQKWTGITVLQGNAGSVVNIGSYGYNIGTAGTVVDGVYVPRITQSCRPDCKDPNKPGKAQWDDRGGLITTRTCSQPNRAGEPQNVTDVTIKNFTVNGLGGDPEKGKGPNSYVRPFAIGVIGDTNKKGDYAGFCFDGGNRSTADTTIGNFTFTNFDLFQNPLRDSLIYDGNQVLPSQQKTTWEPIRFCAGDTICDMPPPGPDASNNRPVTFWPAGTKDDPSKPGYYVCGVGPKGDASKCWTTANLTGPTAAAVNNVDYSDSQDVEEGGSKGYDLGSNIVFPYSP